MGTPSGRDFNEPHATRLDPTHPRRREILAAHTMAINASHDGYIDPVTGYFVFTAAYLADRGTCCDTGCRHCPFVT